MPNSESLENKKRSLEVGIADSVNLAGIFSLFLKDTLKEFLEQSARYILFPLAAVGALIHASLAWRQAKIDKGKNGTWLRARVEIVSALAIITGVIGGFVAATAFSLAAPVIFTAVTGFKALVNAGSALYYWGKSVATTNPTKKTTYETMARTNAINAVAGVFSTVAVGLVMIAAKPIYAILGVIGGLIATAHSLYNRVMMQKVAKSNVMLTQPLLTNANKTDHAHAPSIAARLKNRAANTSIRGDAQLAEVKVPMPDRRPSPVANHQTAYSPRLYATPTAIVESEEFPNSIPARRYTF